METLPPTPLEATVATAEMTKVEATTPTVTRDNRTAFVLRMFRLASPDNPEGKDRAAIAELRGVLRGTPADYYRAAKHVVPYLGDREQRSDTWFFLVGGLIALHPSHKQGVSLGHALGAVARSGSQLDVRFLALLSTRESVLTNTLRQMISLLKAKNQPLDYLMLLRDLCDWSNPENYVQKRWARDYFRTTNDKNEVASAATVDGADTDSTRESE